MFLNPVKEHFTELKILTNKGQRSFVGVTAGKQLVMDSVPSVTVMELAVVAKKLGLVDAINLDGGASSTKWTADMSALPGNAAPAAGSYLKSPGRKISNALIVRLMKEKPVHVTLNGRHLFFDADPYKNTRYDRVIVPLRKIAESLGATVSYDAATRTILVTKGPTTAKLVITVTLMIFLLHIVSVCPKHPR